VKTRLSQAEQNFYNRVDEILFYKWDPIGVSDENWSRDEYQSYTPQVFRIALESTTPERLAEYLNKTATERMGLNPVKEHDTKIAKMILDLKDETI